MSTSEILHVGFSEIPETSLPFRVDEQKTKINEYAKQIFRTIQDRLSHSKAGKFVQRLPAVLRKVVPICLDLAATAFIPIQESLSKPVPGVNLGGALVQNVISLWGIGKTIHKSIHALKEKRELKTQLESAEKKLAFTLDPENRALIEIEIEDLHKKISRCNKQIFSLRHVPSMVTNMAVYTLESTHIIGEHVGMINQVALSGLKAASGVAGAAAGALSLLFGGIESALGIRDLILSRNEKKAVEAKIEEFHKASDSKTMIPDEIWGTLRKARGIQLMREQLKADKHFKLSILRVCGGALASIAGALGIAAAFTYGAAATGIAVAALVVGMIGLGVTIGTYLKRKRLKEEMATLKISNQQLKELITYVKSSQCTEDQKKEIAELLGLDLERLTAAGAHLTHEFRKILCSETDAKNLATYLCVGKSSLAQKATFAQIFDKPQSVVFDRQAFLERIIKKIFKKRKIELSKTDIHELSMYFRTKKAQAEQKEKVSKILKIDVKHLAHPRKVMQNFLVDLVVNPT